MPRIGRSVSAHTERIHGGMSRRPLRHRDGWLKRPIEDYGEPPHLFCQRFPRGHPRFAEPGSGDLVVGKRPAPGHDSADDHDVCLTADQRPPGRRHDVGIGCTRTEDPLVVSREESHGSRRGRRDLSLPSAASQHHLVADPDETPGPRYWLRVRATRGLITFNFDASRNAARAQSRCHPVSSTSSSRIWDFLARSARTYVRAFALVTAWRWRIVKSILGRKPSPLPAPRSDTPLRGGSQVKRGSLPLLRVRE